MVTTTALYAGILGLMALYLGSIPGRMRGRLKISVGDGGYPDMVLAMRRHANFVEWVPLALILIALLEINGAPKMAIHGFGASLVAFRICHAIGLQKENIGVPTRIIGAGGTALLVGAASIWLIVDFFV
jgi:uncharacterized membrane protein YecN with MAPEG domain